jgi:hypothetical protein
MSIVCYYHIFSALDLLFNDATIASANVSRIVDPTSESCDLCDRNAEFTVMPT